MNRWILIATLGTLGAATGCGDDSAVGSGGGGGSGGGPTSGTTTTTTTSTGGQGGEGQGGEGQGGEGQGGEGQGGEGSCGAPGDCAETERCDFRDGLCGAGDRGTCVARDEVCSDDDEVCLCDGTITAINPSCGGSDLDSTGSCELPEGAFACNERVCRTGGGTYCRVTGDDTGGADYAGCNTTDEPSCDDIPTCACLTAEIEGCGGTCEDSPDGATIRCPGG